MLKKLLKAIGIGFGLVWGILGLAAFQTYLTTTYGIGIALLVFALIASCGISAVIYYND